MLGPCIFLRVLYIGCMDSILTERRGKLPISGTREDRSRRAYTSLPESVLAQIDEISGGSRSEWIRDACEARLRIEGGETEG